MGCGADSVMGVYAAGTDVQLMEGARNLTPADDPITVPALTAAMRAWRGAHPQATFAEIEGEATRQVAA